MLNEEIQMPRYASDFYIFWNGIEDYALLKSTRVVSVLFERVSPNNILSRSLRPCDPQRDWLSKPYSFHHVWDFYAVASRMIQIRVDFGGVQCCCWQYDLGSPTTNCKSWDCVQRFTPRFVHMCDCDICQQDSYDRYICCYVSSQIDAMVLLNVRTQVMLSSIFLLFSCVYIVPYQSLRLERICFNQACCIHHIGVSMQFLCWFDAVCLNIPECLSSQRNEEIKLPHFPTQSAFWGRTWCRQKLQFCNQFPGMMARTSIPRRSNQRRYCI